jgi:hypothetical protein
MYAHAYSSIFCAFIIYGLDFFPLFRQYFYKWWLIMNAALICYVAFKMQRVSLLGRFVNISFLGEKTVLRRNVFRMEGRWKGNGIACISVDDKLEVEVTILKNFNVDGGVQYME